MPPSNPPGSFSSMPKGPFLASPHKTDIFTGEPGTRASHLRSAAGTVISCLPFAIFVVVSICLISLRIGCCVNLPYGSTILLHGRRGNGKISEGRGRREHQAAFACSPSPMVIYRKYVPLAL